MKLNRRSLRRLIESVINEDEKPSKSGVPDSYPGSRFKAAVDRGEEHTIAEKKRIATKELQKTYDWFEDVVFPAIEADLWPIKADDDYHTRTSFMFYPSDHDHRDAGMIPKGTVFKSLSDEPVKGRRVKSKYKDHKGEYSMITVPTYGPGYTLADFYASLEGFVIQDNLNVTMQSEQPTEFEEEVEKAKKNQKKDGSGELNESRGSLYRKRYRRY